MLSLTQKALEEFDNQHDFERMCADVLNALGYKNVTLIAPRGGSDNGRDVTFTTENGGKGLACISLRQDTETKFNEDFSQRKTGEYEKYYFFTNRYLTATQKIKFAKYCLEKLNAEFIPQDREALRSLLDTTLQSIRKRYIDNILNGNRVDIASIATDVKEIKEYLIGKERVQVGSKSVLEDENIKKATDAWKKGNFSAALKYSMDAYYKGYGEVKVQAIINVLLLSKDDFTKVDYYISLCDEGIKIAQQEKMMAAEGVLKGHKLRYLQVRFMRKSIEIYSETEMRKRTGFSLMPNSQLMTLVSSAKKDGELIQKLSADAQNDAIKSKDWTALAHVKMTVASAHAGLYFLSDLFGQDAGSIEHFVIKTLIEAKDIYQKLGDQEGEMYVLHNLANNIRFFGDTTRAREFAQQALQIANKIGNLEVKQKAKELIEEKLS